MFKKIALALTALVLGVATIATPAPAMADGPSGHSQSSHSSSSSSAKTAILKSCADDSGNGDGILCLLRQGLEILSYVVGALGFVALVFVGFQYLTAGDNEEQIKKAKRRIVEIVIGVALFLLANVIVQWLTPTNTNNGNNNNSSSQQQNNNGANR